MPLSIRNSVELQSLRGIAALCVVLHHSLRTLEPTTVTAFISETVLNAHAAVVVFFVLSGFVLTKSFLAKGIDAQSVATFYIKRIFRIYPAMWIGCFLGILYLIYISDVYSPHISSWAAGHYNRADANAWSIIQTFLGLYNYILPPLWTITVELMASILLPAMVWLVLRGEGMSLLLVTGLTVVSFISGVEARQVPLYMVDFALGIVLATNRWLARVNPGPIIMGVAVIVIMWFRALYPWLYHDAFPSFVEGLASMVIIAGLVAGNATWMRSRSLVLIGDWSYSLYLIHIPIAFTVARLIDRSGLITTSNIFVSVIVTFITLSLSLPLSALIFRYVEKPGIAAGKALISRTVSGKDRSRVTELS